MAMRCSSLELGLASSFRFSSRPPTHTHDNTHRTARSYQSPALPLVSSRAPSLAAVFPTPLPCFPSASSMHKPASPSSLSASRRPELAQATQSSGASGGGGCCAWFVRKQRSAWSMRTSAIAFSRPAAALLSSSSSSALALARAKAAQASSRLAFAANVAPSARRSRARAQSAEAKSRAAPRRSHAGGIHSFTPTFASAPPDAVPPWLFVRRSHTNWRRLVASLVWPMLNCVSASCSERRDHARRCSGRCDGGELEGVFKGSSSRARLIDFNAAAYFPCRWYASPSSSHT
mmetsp:Transcript_35769/g.69484  ORF Transcript_35769/g.69484 Transcript_35769/m.69484 type:complete len:290 (-) Transcript_35769:129-998(-)